MSFYELDCPQCGGWTSHAATCPVVIERQRAEAAKKRSQLPTMADESPRFRYRGRVYRIVIQARSPGGPVTLETIDEPRETVETTNDRMTMSAFERV